MPSLERYARSLSVYRETSGQAWDSVLPHLGPVDGRILSMVRSMGGATTDELEWELNLRHQTASAQVRHLTEAGWLEDSGERRLTRSGRAAIVWRLAR